MIEQKFIDKAEVGRILALEEGHFLDFKAAKIPPAKLSESVSAFGNTAGGELFVGVSEADNKKQHRWQGFANMEAANGLFRNIPRLHSLAPHFCCVGCYLGHIQR